MSIRKISYTIDTNTSTQTTNTVKIIDFTLSTNLSRFDPTSMI
ncbi:unnamed protein product [Schistosoma curassoni]|uniref:Protein kinase domain-containing protein n=1 Tax=Schistosoma curassoni TaxID=6186 RepID=A0A183KJ23_9TREM|nr:unnamed protein product [Schistosoma curassoni]